MIRPTRHAIPALMLASLLSIGGTQTATGGSSVAGPGDRRLCRPTIPAGLRALARQRRIGMDPRRKRRTQHRVLVDVLADQGGKQMGALGYRRSPSDVERPQGMVDLAEIDRLPSGQDDHRPTCAQIGLKTSDITYVALSHTHGDHIGNVNLFPGSTILMQQVEYSWIKSPDGPNDNVNQLKALARKLLGTPEHLQLIDGDMDLFGDGSVTLDLDSRTHARQPIPAGPSEEFGFCHSFRRRCASRGKF